MTEAEWLVCTDPSVMLTFFHGKKTDRKMRLFLVACCRRAWHLLKDERSRNAVEVAERFAEGLVSDGERKSAQRAADEAWETALRIANSLITLDENGEEIARPGWEIASNLALAAGCVDWATRSPERLAWGWSGSSYVTARNAQNASWAISGLKGSGEPTTRTAQLGVELLQCRLLRCIFGPLPFRSVSFDSTWQAWNGGTAVKLATSIYDDRAFDRLPIVADALEDAGCDNADMLRHCREPGEHVRGCWVVDLLLGKS